MFFYTQNAKIVACILLFRKSHNKPNLKRASKYGFSPDSGGKNGGVTSMRMQVILDSSFRPPGFSPYMGREERRVQGLDYSITWKARSKSNLFSKQESFTVLPFLFDS